MKPEDISMLKYDIIKWLRLGIKEFDRLANDSMTEELKAERKRFSDCVEEFVNILEDQIPESME